MGATASTSGVPQARSGFSACSPAASAPIHATAIASAGVPSSAVANAAFALSSSGQARANPW